MNERIKQLAEQAGMNIVDDKFSTYGKFAEKFAELIVYDVLSDLTNDDSLGAARIESIRRLAERYGVAR